MSTPAERENALLASALRGLGFIETGAMMAANFRALGPYPRKGLPTALAAVLPIDWIEALRIAVARAPRTRYRRRIELGHHQRQECLERPGSWCRLSGSGRCDPCPDRNRELDRLRRALESAEELRRKWDTAIWSTKTEGERNTV